MTGGLLRTQLAVAGMSGAFRGGAAAAVLLGAATAIYPMGVSVGETGEGFVPGVVSGITTGIIVAVLLAAAIAIQHVGWDEQEGTARQLFVAGLRPDRRRLAWVATSAVAALAAVPLGAAGGGLAALARSISGAQLVGEAELTLVALVIAAAGALYTGALAAGAAAKLGGGAPGALAVAGGFAIFLFLLAVFGRDSWPRHVLEVMPFAPLWSSALPEGHSYLVLPMSPAYRLAVALFWVALAMGAVLSKRAPEGGQRDRR